MSSASRASKRGLVVLLVAAAVGGFVVVLRSWTVGDELPPLAPEAAPPERRDAMADLGVPSPSPNASESPPRDAIDAPGSKSSPAERAQAPAPPAPEAPEALAGPERSFVVDVVGPSGPARDGVSVGVTWCDVGLSASVEAEVQPQDDGSWRVRVREGQGGPMARYRLCVNWADHGSRALLLPRVPPARIEVRFGSPTSATVVLDGRTEPGVTYGVFLEAVEEIQNTAPSVPNLDAIRFRDGRRTIDGLGPGDYRLLVYAGEKREWPWLVHEEFVSLRDGENSLRVQPPSLQRLTISVPLTVRKQGGGWIALERANVVPVYGANQRVVTLDSEGKAIFPFAAPGRYVAWLYSSEQGPDAEMTLDAGALESVVFERAPAAAVRVAISDSDGILKRAGLEEGDRILELDGRGASDARALRRLVLDVSRLERFSTLVERGGQRRVLTLDGSVFRTDAAVGGRLEYVR